MGDNHPTAASTAAETMPQHAEPPRKHTRTSSTPPTSTFRESLHAFAQEMSDGSRHLNQYCIRGVIGHGSYGLVHYGELTEDPSFKIAAKEFQKARLRRFRLIGEQRRHDHKLGTPALQLHDINLGNNERSSVDPLFLIRSEIAIMKRVRHPNVVRLYEALDDAVNQRIYMMFEYCGDGPVIKLEAGRMDKPLPDDVAHFYFVQVLQGVDYLHANGIVHRDIKPDNLLLTDNACVCKIVDFGVSEMFEKGNDTMHHAVGSPAFMSPELCKCTTKATHGRSDDIWSLGVTLYAMLVGKLPFFPENLLDLAHSIVNEEPEYPEYLSSEAKDLLKRMLDKDENTRITAQQILNHPWVTRNGTHYFEPAQTAKHCSLSEEELHGAICRISSMFTVARAVSKFKRSNRDKSQGTSVSVPEDNVQERRTFSTNFDDLPHRDSPEMLATVMDHPPPGMLDGQGSTDEHVMLNGMALCSSP